MLPLKFLNKEGNITEWDPFEWCQWLFAAGKTPGESAQTVCRFDNETSCGLVWSANCIAFRCQTCGYSPNMSLCRECFHEGDHEGHEISMYHSFAGGFCDCGNKSALRETGFCQRHSVNDQTNPPEVPKDVLCVAEALRPQLFSRLVQKLQKTLCVSNQINQPEVSYEVHIAETLMPQLFSRLVQYLQKSYDQWNFATDKAVKKSKVFNSLTANNSAIGKASEAGTSSNKTYTDLDKLEISHTNQPDTVSQALGKMLSESYLSDFTLKVGDRTFPVHKSVLGVRSKVFRAMFDSEMKEMQENCVNIKDMDSDTLQRMLQFVYSDRLDKDMGWTEASSLYAAADFYALEPLKQGCSTILKKSLYAPNALEVLALADLHQDQQLKSAVLDFISLTHQDIIGTEAWFKFEEENAKLALETFRELYSKKIKG